MSHMIVQAQAIGIMNSKILKKEDLPADYSTLGLKWMTSDQPTLLSGDYADYWVIVKMMDGSSNYKMFCGKNVPWRNTAFNIPDKIPSVIIVIENSEFKGILIGDVITDLIRLGQFGIFLWITSTTAPAHQTLMQFMSAHSSAPPSVTFVHPPIQFVKPGGAIINAGGTLYQLPAGGHVQVIKHDSVPNMIQPLSNISHFKIVRRC